MATLALVVAGSLAGFGAAVRSHASTSSLWPAGFAFVMTFYLIGRDATWVINHSPRRARLGLYTMPPISSTTIIGCVALAGEPLWLAVVLGIAGSALLECFIGRAFVPSIAAEEGAADQYRRWLRPDAGGSPARPMWPRRGCDETNSPWCAAV